MFKWALNRLWAIMSKTYLERSQKSMVEHFCDKLTTFSRSIFLQKSSIVLTKIVNDLLFSQKSHIINVRRGTKYILDSGSGFILYGKYKTLWLLFMDEVSKGYRATARIQFTFYYPAPRSSWYSFNQLQPDERLK